MSESNTPSDARSEKDHVPEKLDSATERDLELNKTRSRPAADKPSKLQWTLTVLGLCSCAMLYGLDTTIAADVQGSIYESLGDIEKLPWVGIGFPMGSVSIILLVGRLYTEFEIKWLIIGFMTLFEAGSALCGAAPTATALVVGRVLAGMGGAGIYIGALTYISCFTSLRERPLYNATLGLSWGIGAILGPVIGGAFSVNTGATWRWAFYINLPLAAVLAPIYLFSFPKFNPHPTVSTGEKLKRIDWVGTVLNIASFTLITVALTLSGSTWKWNSAGPIATFVLWGIVAITYIVQQTFCIFTDRSRRLLPIHFLKSRTFVLLFLATSAAGTAVATTIYYVPLIFQFTKGDSALKAAVRLLPVIIPFVASNMFSGGLLPVLNRYAPWYLVGGVFVLCGAAPMFVIDANTPVGHIYGFELLIALGGGFTFQLAYSIAASISEPADIGNAIGFINVSQIGSMTIALSIAGSIFQNVGVNKLNTALASYHLDQGLISSALAGAQSKLLTASTKEIQTKAISAIVDTLADDFALVISSGAIMVVCAAAMRWEKVNLTPTAG